MNIFKIMMFGGLGATARYILSIIIPGSLFSITVINMLGVFILGLTEDHDTFGKEHYQVGILGGFTSISAIMLLFLPIISFIINVLLGLLVYHFSKKIV